MAWQHPPDGSKQDHEKQVYVVPILVGLLLGWQLLWMSVLPTSRHGLSQPCSDCNSA
jgi:hypothetical protein